ncbi:MAG: hypothetical protein NE330_01360 [Lentisphaeraceae bacterium]|nr:hypothetical protein [Lentisphaeraceae bacterium]
MNSFFKNLASRPMPWLCLSGPSSPIVLSTKMSLARNIAGQLYPDKLDELTGLDVLEDIFEVSESLPDYERLNSYELNTLNEIEKDLLLERSHITHNSVFSGIAGVIVDEEEYFSVLVNDEDHMKLQVMRPGLELHKSWKYLSYVDDIFGKKLKYDFSNDYGYLTASPEHVGTGLKCEVLLDLTCLYLSGQINGLVQSSRVFGYELHAAENQDNRKPQGRYILSTVKTLGVKEEKIISSFKSFINDIIDAETRSRVKLMADSPHRIQNLVSRAYGTLKYNFMLDEGEAFDLLMTLRLGLQLGLFENLEFKQVEEALTCSGNAHLQSVVQELLSTEDLNKTRASMVRKKIGLAD